MTLAGVVKEDLACSGSSLPKLWPIGLGRYARHALDIMLGETYQQPQKKIKRASEQASQGGGEGGPVVHELKKNKNA